MPLLSASRTYSLLLSFTSSAGNIFDIHMHALEGATGIKNIMASCNNYLQNMNFLF